MRKRLVALILALGTASSAQTPEPQGTFTLDHPAVNGVSGLEVFSGGTRFAAVTDQGWFLTGRFIREDGAISDVEIEQFLPIRGSDGFPVAARRVGDHSDAEGLAIAEDGTWYVTFERWSRAAAFPDPRSPAVHIRDHPTFYDYAENRQLEAAAIGPDGYLRALPEQRLGDLAGFPVYRLAPDGWEIEGTITRRDRFSVVGADFSAEGDFYLLERKLILGLWWQNRIRVFDRPSGDGRVLWTSRPGQHFNLEGIAVWSDPSGQWLTLVSDNNRDPDEPTQFVEFRLTD